MRVVDGDAVVTGVFQSCQKWRDEGYTHSTTYLIDPDGAPRNGSEFLLLAK